MYKNHTNSHYEVSMNCRRYSSVNSLILLVRCFTRRLNVTQFICTANYRENVIERSLFSHNARYTSRLRNYKFAITFRRIAECSDFTNNTPVNCANVERSYDPWYPFVWETNSDQSPRTDNNRKNYPSSYAKAIYSFIRADTVSLIEHLFKDGYV